MVDIMPLNPEYYKQMLDKALDERKKTLDAKLNNPVDTKTRLRNLIITYGSFVFMLGIITQIVNWLTSWGWFSLVLGIPLTIGFFGIIAYSLWHQSRSRPDFNTGV